MKTFTPKIGIIVIVLFLVISAAVMVYNRNESTSTGTSASGSPYASNNSTLAANAEKEGNIGEYYDGTQSSTSSPATPAPKLSDIKIYIYPSSTIKVSTAKKLELESNATAEKITEWYKNKIDELNFNAKSYAQTNTGGVIFNKLSAARPGEKLDITIKKDQTTSKILITVDRS